MIGRFHSVAVFTLLLFTTELLTLPCGTTCHRAQADHADTQTSDPSAEHSCHEAPTQEDVAQIAASPTSCTHQHDVPDSLRRPVSTDRDHHTASIPVPALLPSRESVVRTQTVLFPEPRHSISPAIASISLRI